MVHVGLCNLYIVTDYFALYQLLFFLNTDTFCTSGLEAPKRQRDVTYYSC